MGGATGQGDAHDEKSGPVGPMLAVDDYARAYPATIALTGSNSSKWVMQHVPYTHAPHDGYASQDASSYLAHGTARLLFV